jgi:hypothetical protein
VLLAQFGQGQATVFLDGRKVQANWKKADRKARTRFYDSFGVEIAFNRGPIFIEVLGSASLLMTSETADGLLPMPEYSPPPPGAFPPESPSEEPPAPSATPTPAGSASPSPSASATPAGGTPVASRTPGPGGSATVAPSSSQPPATVSPPAASATPH